MGTEESSVKYSYPSPPPCARCGMLKYHTAVIYEPYRPYVIVDLSEVCGRHEQLVLVIVSQAHSPNFENVTRKNNPRPPSCLPVFSVGLAISMNRAVALILEFERFMSVNRIRLVDLFEKVDMDKGGTIDAEELREFLKLGQQE